MADQAGLRTIGFLLSSATVLAALAAWATLTASTGPL
jgi:hypothetical protein